MSAAGGDGELSAPRRREANIITVAWTGTVCTNPAMLYISRKTGTVLLTISFVRLVNL